MTSNWKECKIGDIVEIRRGASPRPIHQFISNKGMPWVKIADATSDNSRYIRKTNEFIIYDGVKHSVLVEPETLIVSNSATPGLPKIMKIQACVHDGWLVFSNYQGLLRDFLYYKFIDIQKKLLNQANGSVFQNLKTDIVKDFDILLPPLETQQKIAKVLSAIDDKIELNNLINNNLEQQAQAIFKSWFVDFEPFGGTMPDDWQCIQLDKVADFIGGYSYKGNELQSSKYAMATIKNFERNGGFKLDGYKEIIPSDKCKIEQEAKLYDILVAHTDLTQNADVIGNTELLLCTDKYEKIIFSMDVVKVVPKNNMPHFILATMLKSKEFKSHCLGYVNGTTVLHLSKKALPDYIINIPNGFGILSELEQTLKNIYTLISNNLNENIKLIQLRDTLLPKLMSGKIDVDKVEV
ncbi:MAG: restriction endonuclease subunit S [Cyanobacteria bacterium SIG32]|nr:restriction endonuclease subunit S [Cyanobacteria bacterium SIG32]